MKQAGCPQEEAVSRAARSGRWDEPLAAHAAQCAVCGEVARAARWMQELARDEGEMSPLPDPILLWQRAQWAEMLSEKEAEAERVHAVVGWVKIASLMVIAIALAAWGIGNGQMVESALGWFVTALSPQTWVVAYDAARANSIAIWTVAGLASVAVFFLASGILAEE